MANKKRDRRDQYDVTKYRMDFEIHDLHGDYSEETKKIIV